MFFKNLYLSLFFTFLSFEEKEMENRFSIWRNKNRFIQIRYISLLTGLLYILVSLMDYLFAPKEVVDVLWKTHFFFLPPILFFISYISTNKRYIKLSNIMLILVPVFAALSHLYISLRIQMPATFTAELYLLLFWIFTVSGLRLKEALFSALCVFLISLYIGKDFDSYNLVMHVFWNVSSFSFGLLGAFLLERSYRNSFIDEINLEKLSQTDSRARLNIVMQDELERMRRFNHCFACIFIDIDYFKNINDTYGHKTGDIVLIEVAELIKRFIRKNDSAVRWGGEEFILICVEVNKEATLAVCEHLRKSMQDNNFTKIKNLSISIGCTLSQQDDTHDRIIQRADKALYQAKNKGRNCVVYL
ncbi:MAG: hypothetical protein COA44_04795 [Arcobacter sp.]|nr:MAG: hypothetical protein COA44_04795 [Arcobacter sp.]